MPRGSLLLFRRRSIEILLACQIVRLLLSLLHTTLIRVPGPMVQYQCELPMESPLKMAHSTRLWRSLTRERESWRKPLFQDN